MLKKFIFGITLSLIGVFSLGTPLFATNGAGLPGAFLRNPVGARANGMGSAFTAIAQDPSACWWNPGGLAFVDRFQLSVMYSMMSMDRLHNFAGISLTSENSGTLGIHLLQFGVADIDGRDANGVHTGYFDDNEMAVGLSYGVKIGSYLGIGATGKYLMQSLSDYEAKGYSIDAGFLLNVRDEFYIGFIAKNIISSLQWNSESNLNEALPKIYRAGIGIRPLALPLLLTLDALKYEREKDKKVTLFGGCEVWIVPDILALRGGLANGDLTTGASIGWQSKKFGFRLDYAYLPDVLEQGSTSQIQFGIEF